MKRILSLLFLVCTINIVNAQVGSIQGKVVDEKGQPVPFVVVVIVSDDKGSNPTNPSKTNVDGFYAIKPLNPGRYNLMVKMLGYQPEIVTGIEVSPNKPTEVKIKLEKSSAKVLLGAKIVAKKFEKPILDKKETSTGTNITATEIKQLATRDINSIAASQGGVYQEDEGGAINIAGAQSAGTQIMIDGMKVSSNAKIPPSAIGQLQVITGGVPARYGDLSGGVISITTKDPAKEISGGIEAITSTYLDPWGYNLVNAYLTGPLIVKKDTLRKTKKSILGYFVTGEVQYQKDRYLTTNGIYKVKDADYEAIKKDPLLFSTDGTRILQRAELINSSNIEKISSHQNTRDYQYRLQGKLDYKISEDFSITASGAFDINRYNQYIERYSLFNFENNPVHNDRTYRGFLRFRHNIGASKANAPSTDEASTKKSAIQNAYYIAQVDFEKTQNDFFDGKHGFSPFNYGHVGFFERQRAPTLEHKRNEKVFFGSGVDDFVRLEGFFILNDKDTGVKYSPGTINPLAAGLTSYYINMVQTAGLDKEKFYGSMSAIEQNNGLVNGNRANTFIQELYYPFGRAYNGMSRDADNEQYRFRFDGSFDAIKTGAEQNMHTIEYGFEYEQRVLRKYALNPITLWRMASLYTNSHIARNPKDLNPLLTLNEGKVKMYLQDYITQINNGVDTLIFFTSDTIEYESKVNRSQQTTFSRRLRNSLGLSPDGSEFINTDALDPSQLKMEFFTPDELLDAWGLNGVRYQGYDPYGNRLTTNPSFNDFFTKKDVNGVFTREVGAFKPIYFAGYIQDKFQFKDLTFNLGLRVDRFDANQKVLRDKYSLYAVHKIGDFGPGTGKKFNTEVEDVLRNAPSNLSQNAVVYVDKAIGPTKVTGFRDGDFWYDNKGNLIGSPAAIISASGGNIQPLLLVQNEKANSMIDSSYNPDNSFTDYSPIWNIMPRLQFSFPVTEKSIFFAHYDVLSQRPYQDVLLTSPMDWYLAFGKNFTSFINNPNLKMQKTIDFQLGFKQELSRYLGLTISTFYREFKDQIQFTKIIGAYPKDYFTFENLDFGTTKGGQIDLEMRPYSNANGSNFLRLKLAYTLSFAEGTGSDTRTQFSIIEGGNTNLRLINPLNYDARHTFVTSADYHFPSARDPNYNGPVIGKSKILADFGINIQTTMRTGTPYTKQANVLPDAKLVGSGRSTTEGSINSARLPMSFRINLKVDKSFKIKYKGDNEAEGIKAKYFDFNVYVQIKNLLNTDNILSVYRYTGNADEDGYLTSAIGKVDIQSKENQLAGKGQSFVDLYKIALEQPTGRTSYFSQPRTIQLGASFSF